MTANRKHFLKYMGILIGGVMIVVVLSLVFGRGIQP
jgi:hypothetical protein